MLHLENSFVMPTLPNLELNMLDLMQTILCSCDLPVRQHRCHRGVNICIRIRLFTNFFLMWEENDGYNDE